MTPPARATSPDFLTRLCAYLLGLLLLSPYLIRPVFAPDLWLHLKTGEWILAHGVPHADPFSFTKAGLPWIDHEWLFQLLVHAIFRWSGIAGLVLLRTACLAALTTLLTRILIRVVPLSSAVTLVGLTLIVLRIRVSLAPELLTLLCLLITLDVLASRRRHPYAVWALVPLQALWSNLHGFALLGWALTLWVFVGETLMLRRPLRWWTVEGGDRTAWRRLELVLLAQTAALWLTPYGWEGLRYPFTILRSVATDSRSLLGFVEELRPITIVRGSYVAWFAVLAGLGALSFMPRHHRKDVGLLIPFLLSEAIGILINRQVGVFALFTACAVAWNLSGMTDRAWVRGVRIGSVAGLIACVSWAEAAFFSFRSSDRTVDFNVPQRAVEYLVRHPRPGELFNTFNCGAYLIFRAWPEHRVFIDGRTELYGTRFIHEEYLAAIRRKVTWDQTITRYGIRTAITDHQGWEGALLAKHLRRHPDWRLEYADRQASIFVYDPGNNRAIIKNSR